MAKKRNSLENLGCVIMYLVLGGFVCYSLLINTFSEKTANAVVVIVVLAVIFAWIILSMRREMLRKVPGNSAKENSVSIPKRPTAQRIPNKRNIRELSTALNVSHETQKIKTKYNDADLADEQKALYELIEKTNGIIFITGKAGTGKSFLLEYFVACTNKQVAVVAPTGVAALNINGQTIHSFFGIDFNVQKPNDAEQMRMSNKRRAILSAIDVLVIDEVSMVRVDIIEAINKKMQIANNNSEPFGGKQVVLFGDLYQLPPVIDSGQLSRYLEDTYGTVFFFGAPSLLAGDLKVYELAVPHRQKDQEYLDILNNLRVGALNQSELDRLNQRCLAPPDDGGFLTLTTTNAVADRTNIERLQKLDQPEFSYDATITGSITESAYPAPKTLILRVGAQVMMLRNDYTDATPKDPKQQRRWVNGTLGIVSSLNVDTIKVLINGVEHSINKASWQKTQYEYDAFEKRLTQEVVATFKQYPLKLAWAVTIHKAQGQTYQSVAIDLGLGAFEAGQMYVALSRCVSMDTLYLRQPINSSDIKVNQEVSAFMDSAVVLTENNSDGQE